MFLKMYACINVKPYTTKTEALDRHVQKIEQFKEKQSNTKQFEVTYSQPSKMYVYIYNICLYMSTIVDKCLYMYIYINISV